MQRDSIDFEKGNVRQLFHGIFIPTLLGMLGMSAVTAVDGIFVGHTVGSEGLAAINILVPVFMLLTGLGLMIGMGCSVVASVHLSEGNEKAARLNVTQAMIFITLVTLLIIVPMLLFPDATGRLFGSSEQLLPLVREYLIWNFPSCLFLVWEAVALFVIRLDGSPKFAMTCHLVTAALNVVLDWCFMFPLGWGVKGAAFATAISITVGGLIAMTYMAFYAKTLYFVRIKSSMKSGRLSIRNIGYQCRIGFSALLGEATMAVLIFMGNLMFMRYIGDDGVGAYGIVCYYTPFIFMVGNAIAQSAQPIISFNLGLRRHDRICETERTALQTAILCGLTVSLIFGLFPEYMVELFVSDDSHAAQIAIQGFPYFALGFIPFILNLTAVGYFQSVERMYPATLFAISRGFILLIPSFLLLPLLLADKGIWLAMPVSEWLSICIIGCFYLYRRSK